ncbi:MAG: cobyric acid synthase CobQ, partial [Methanothrix sp.]|nr:cobyric acid synthase CobQ [Methanothrix sp.]
MTRFIVVLGTCSHSGKSTIVAALCRILKNRGLKVAPFKSQNMSLNSWVTSDGKEMGIAQAVQAWAAGIEPKEVMNPILLKPKGDR